MCTMSNSYKDIKIHLKVQKDLLNTITVMKLIAGMQLNTIKTVNLEYKQVIG